MNYEITVNQLNKEDGNIRAFASVVFEESFKVSNIAVIENFIPGVLKYRRERVIYLYKIREFIYNQNLFLVRPVIGNGLK